MARANHGGLIAALADIAMGYSLVINWVRRIW